MAQFEDLVLVVRNLSHRAVLGGVISGDLLLNTSETLHALQACDGDPSNTNLVVLHPLDTSLVALGTTVQVEIGTPRPAFGLLPEDLDSLLQFPGAHINEPAHYYLLDIDYYNKESVPAAHPIERYRAVLSFVRMLKTCAAFLDGQEELLVFVQDGKFELPVRYRSHDLNSLNLPMLQSLMTVIPEGIHRDQCASIMAEAVHDMTAKLPAAKRLAALLENAHDLKERFEKGYQLFAAGFSYERIRDEIEAARVEYSGKIHKVFSDIQNQLLSIPVATIIVATQMKESTKVDGNFWISLAVLLGAFVFMLLMHFLLRNQRHTLEVIGIEIKRQKMTLEKEHESVAKNFEDTFNALDNRYRTQRHMLCVIEMVVVVGFAFSVFFFYKLSAPIQQWF